MSNSKIEIVPYCQSWPLWFENLKEYLYPHLKDLILRFDHIGSTSVPGLGAKNRLDVQLSVEMLDTQTKEALDLAFTRLGFNKSIFLVDHRPPWDDQSEGWQKLYVKGGCQKFDFAMNIHIRKHGNPNQVYAILFRDYLRKHPDSAQAYYRLKCELARFHPDDIDAYCEIKDPACDLIMVAARDWAKRVNWSLDYDL